jgi:hypothetical protein
MAHLPLSRDTLCNDGSGRQGRGSEVVLEPCTACRHDWSQHVLQWTVRTSCNFTGSRGGRVRVCDWMVERDAGAAKAVQRVASTLCARPRRQGASSAMWAAVTRAVVWSPPFAPRSTCDSTTWIQDLTPLRKVRGSHLGSAVALRDRRLCDADLQLVCAAIVA